MLHGTYWASILACAGCGSAQPCVLRAVFCLCTLAVLGMLLRLTLREDRTRLGSLDADERVVEFSVTCNMGVQSGIHRSWCTAHLRSSSTAHSRV